MKSKKICLLLGKPEETFKLKKAILRKNWQVISKNKKRLILFLETTGSLAIIEKSNN